MLKDPGKRYEEKTINESTMRQNSNQSPNQRRFRDSQAGLLTTRKATHKQKSSLEP